MEDANMSDARSLPVTLQLSEFIQRERDRFDTKHNNMFAFSWSEVARYRGYLDIIFGRYTQASRDFMENTKAQQALTKPGTHPMTPEQMRFSEQGAEISARLHLEIESFYLFTKILLDKVARALEFYFGKGRGRSLDSHDDLTKHFPAYAEQKALQLDAPFIALIAKCKKEIADYRDYQIAHEKSPRTTRSTMYSRDGTNVRMLLNQIYPKDTDTQIESASLDTLLPLVDEYVAAVLAFVTQNCDKTALRIEAKRMGNSN